MASRSDNALNAVRQLQSSTGYIRLGLTPQWATNILLLPIRWAKVGWFASRFLAYRNNWGDIWSRTSHFYHRTKLQSRSCPRKSNISRSMSPPSTRCRNLFVEQDCRIGNEAGFVMTSCCRNICSETLLPYGFPAPKNIYGQSNLLAMPPPVPLEEGAFMLHTSEI